MSDKKPSFTGSPRLDERFGLKPTVLVDVKDKDDPDTVPQDYERWESPGREIRISRHQVFSLILIKKSKELIMIPYALIESGTGEFNGDRFTFRFTRDELLYEAVIEGTIDHTQRVVDYLCAGKAELIRANGQELRLVTWGEVTEPKKEPVEKEEEAK